MKGGAEDGESAYQMGTASCIAMEISPGGLWYRDSVLRNVAARKAATHSAKGDPWDAGPAVAASTAGREMQWGVVMSRGNKMRFRRREPNSSFEG